MKIGQIYHVIEVLECALATAILQRQCSTVIMLEIYNGRLEPNGTFATITHDGIL
jgi:hypothetical protein